jgi:hypothetical protein
MNEAPSATRVKALLGAVPKSDILKPPPTSPLAGLHGRMVDIVCGSCGERLGMVTDEPDEPWLTRWIPTFTPRPSTKGEPLWTVQAESLPPEAGSAAVHCFTHGPVEVTGTELRQEVGRYRQGGRRTRLVLNSAHR